MPELSQQEDFWEDLFPFLEDGKIIPVVGSGVITAGPDNRLLYPWLARRLAERLGIEIEASGDDLPTLNEVACAHLVSGGQPNLLYTRLASILRQECPEPGETLTKLASINAFRLFVSAGFDPLLERAINLARFGATIPPPGAPATEVAAYSPNAESKDIARRAQELAVPLVYHILGKVSPTPEYVVWEGDALDFICGLHQHMPVMENLARDLKDHALLLLGLNFSDWLTRFFLRVARQTPLSVVMSHTHILADSPGISLPDSLILFFKSSRTNIQAVPCDPINFVDELSRRWEASAASRQGSATSTSGIQMPREIPDGAVFISYSRDDEPAAHVLKSRLEQAGCLVWFDRERNEGGDNFARKMERAVKEQASVFISVVSAQTENKGMAWCHRERRWAAQRSEFFSEGEVFYVPTVIDDTVPPFRREPSVFSDTHCEPSPGGAASDGFCRRVRELQIHNCRLLGINLPQLASLR